MLGAPGSNNYRGPIASSTTSTSGREVGKVQVLSDEDANELCEKYLPLAYKTASLYVDRGIALDELRSASVDGLFKASRKYDPELGAFGPYARFWCRGEITALFKPGKDALGHSSSLNPPAFEHDEQSESILDNVADEPTPALNPDVNGLTGKERRIVLGRLAGETLRDTGKALNLSAERVRQIEARTHKKLCKTKDNYAFKIAARDHEARLFRDEYLACNGKVSALQRRKGYRKPYFNFRNLENQRLEQIKYSGRHCSKAEIEACKPQECILPPNVIPPLWSPPSASPSPSYPVVEINRNGRGEPLQRPGEGSRSNAEARWLVKALRLNKDARLTRLPLGVEQKQVLEIEHHRNEGLRQLHGVPDSFETRLSAALLHHRAICHRLENSRGNYPLRNAPGLCGGPVIHGWPR